MFLGAAIESPSAFFRQLRTVLCGSVPYIGGVGGNGRSAALVAAPNLAEGKPCLSGLDPWRIYSGTPLVLRSSSPLFRGSFFQLIFSWTPPVLRSSSSSSWSAACQGLMRFSAGPVVLRKSSFSSLFFSGIPTGAEQLIFFVATVFVGA